MGYMAGGGLYALPGKPLTGLPEVLWNLSPRRCAGTLCGHSEVRGSGTGEVSEKRPGGFNSFPSPMLNIPENKSPCGLVSLVLKLFISRAQLRGMFTVRGMLAKDLLGFSKNRWAMDMNRKSCSIVFSFQQCIFGILIPNWLCHCRMGWKNPPDSGCNHPRWNGTCGHPQN